MGFRVWVQGSGEGQGKHTVDSSAARRAAHAGRSSSPGDARSVRARERRRDGVPAVPGRVGAAAVALGAAGAEGGCCSTWLGLGLGLGLGVRVRLGGSLALTLRQFEGVRITSPSAALSA